MAKKPPIEPELWIMSGIGHVCVNWALLEMAILHIICSLADMPTTKGEIIFGGLDIQPRINMAINLANHQKAPRNIVNDLKGIRKAIQGGLSERRNLVVHGAHLQTDVPENVRLHMSRWPEPKKQTEMSATDFHILATDIQTQINAALGSFSDVTDWKLRKHGKKTSTVDVDK